MRIAKDRIGGEEVNLLSPDNRNSLPNLFREKFEFKFSQLSFYEFRVIFNDW